MKTALAFLGGILGFFALAALIVYLTAGFSWLTADTRGETDAREQTRANGTYRIAAYEKFYDQCAAVKSTETQIKAQKELLPTVTGNRVADVQTNIAALTASRASLINQYNADAAKTDTRGHFLASDLPYELNETMETTTCAA